MSEETKRLVYVALLFIIITAAGELNYRYDFESVDLQEMYHDR